MSKTKTVGLKYLAENYKFLHYRKRSRYSNKYTYYFNDKTLKMVKIKTEYDIRWSTFCVSCGIKYPESSRQEKYEMWKNNEANAKYYKITPYQEIEKEWEKYVFDFIDFTAAKMEG